MRYLHDVHKISTYKSILSVYQSVHMIQLENSWTDLDEIWHGRYAIGDSLKSYFSIFYNW
jgi:hypothetical protein